MRMINILDRCKRIHITRHLTVIFLFIQVDIIVNTTSHNLDLQNGAVSISLSKAAGKELQDEVKVKFPQGLEHCYRWT